MNCKDKSKTCTVYAIRCTMTGRVYVGVTGAITGRIKQHFRELESQSKACHVLGASGRPFSLWQLDYIRYGRYAFEVYVLEGNIPFTQRKEAEQKWIKAYEATNPKYGYNTQGIDADEFEILPGRPPFPNERSKELRPAGDFIPAPLPEEMRESNDE